MGKTPAERQREYRARKKAQRLLKKQALTAAQRQAKARLARRIREMEWRGQLQSQVAWPSTGQGSSVITAVIPQAASNFPYAGRKEWLKLIGREDMFESQSSFKYQTVCSEHFAPNDIKLAHAHSRKMLCQLTTPTLCLPLQLEANEAQTSTVSVSTSTEDSKPQTSTEQSQNDEPNNEKIENDEPSNKKKRNDNRLSQKVDFDFNSWEQLKKLSKIYTNLQLRELIKCYDKLKLSKTSLTHEIKMQCLNFYYASSQSYKLLQNAMNLPNVSTLYNNITITTTINEELMSCLKMKCTNMTLTEMQCIVVVDAMPLTPALNYDHKLDKIVGFRDVNGVQSPALANKALVMMVRGMFVDWQQPIGYALISQINDPSQIANWINLIINKLRDIGLFIRVLTFASKAEADFFESRWISIEATFFFLKNLKIYYVSDPKMLLDMFRYDWSLYDIRYDGCCLAKYEHVKQFFEKDKKSQYRLAPNLLDIHIYPTDSDKNDAEEVFSKTVASGISAYIDRGEIDVFGRHTVELIVLINELLTLFNDYKVLFNPKQSHVDFLKRMSVLFRKLKWVDSKNKEDISHESRSIRGFLINISTYLWMIGDFKIPHSTLASSPKRLLNQGMTDNFFEQIRLRTNAIKPTARQFGIAFRQLVILDAIRPLRNRDSPKYHPQFFARVQKLILRHNFKDLANNLLDSEILPETERSTRNQEEITNPYFDFSHIDRSERHTLIYVSGFLLKNCKKYHNCQLFKNYADGIGENVTLNHFTRYLEYSRKHHICLMTIPCNHFVIIVEKMEYLFINLFKDCYFICKVEETLREKIKKIMIIEVEYPPCPCFPWNYFIKLFIRLRIAYTILLNNREFARNRKDFVIPLLMSDNFIKVKS